jgi:hypothetical protein
MTGRLVLAALALVALGCSGDGASAWPDAPAAMPDVATDAPAPPQRSQDAATAPLPRADAAPPCDFWCTTNSGGSRGAAVGPHSDLQ